MFINPVEFSRRPLEFRTYRYQSYEQSGHAYSRESDASLYARYNPATV